MKNFLIVLIACSALFTACESEDAATVDQNRIYTIYEAIYDQDANTTKVRAQFKLGNIFGTLLKLTAPAEVRFNNDVLEFKPGFEFYEKEYAGQVTTGSFTYKDATGVSYTNNVTNFQSINYPANFTGVTRNQANTFAWTGSPLSAREEVYFFIRNSTTANTQTFFTNNVGATNLILAADKLNNLAPSVAAEADLHRNRTDSLTQKTSAGGYLRLSYQIEKKNLTVN